MYWHERMFIRLNHTVYSPVWKWVNVLSLVGTAGAIFFSLPLVGYYLGVKQLGYVEYAPSRFIIGGGLITLDNQEFIIYHFLVIAVIYTGSRIIPLFLSMARNYGNGYIYKNGNWVPKLCRRRA